MVYNNLYPPVMDAIMPAFVIVENKEDWIRHYDKKLGRFDGCTFGGGTPEQFPVAYRTCKEARVCDWLEPVPIKIAKKKIARGY